jgi:hypothetical protein
MIIIEKIEKKLKEIENENELDVSEILYEYIVDLCNDYDYFKKNKKDIFSWLCLKNKELLDKFSNNGKDVKVKQRKIKGSFYFFN